MKILEGLLLSLLGGFSVLTGGKHPELQIYNLIICAIIGCILSFYFDKEWNIKQALKRSAASLFVTSIVGAISWHLAPITLLTYSGMLITPFVLNLLQYKHAREAVS